MWHHRQAAPLDTAVFWTEYVIKWGSASNLYSIARELPFYQYALLDVISAYIVGILLILSFIWFLLSKISSLFMKGGKQKLH